MKIKIIKSNSSDPAWQEYVGKEFEAIEHNEGRYYELPDRSSWLPDEVEIIRKSEGEKVK